MRSFEGRVQLRVVFLQLHCPPPPLLFSSLQRGNLLLEAFQVWHVSDEFVQGLMWRCQNVFCVGGSWLLSPLIYGLRGPSSESSLYGEPVFHLLDDILVSFTYVKTLLHSMAITDIHGASW